MHQSLSQPYFPSNTYLLPPAFLTCPLNLRAHPLNRSAHPPNQRKQVHLNQRNHLQHLKHLNQRNLLQQRRKRRRCTGFGPDGFVKQFLVKIFGLTLNRRETTQRRLRIVDVLIRRNVITLKSLVQTRKCGRMKRVSNLLMDRVNAN